MTKRSTGARIHCCAFSVDMPTLLGITECGPATPSRQNQSTNVKVVKKAYLCTNCLGKGHLVFHCPAGSCRLCENCHYTLLHRDEAHVKNRPITTRRSPTRSSTPSSTHSSTPRPTNPSTPPRVWKILRSLSSPQRRRRQWLRKSTTARRTESLTTFASEPLHNGLLVTIQINILND